MVQNINNQIGLLHHQRQVKSTQGSRLIGVADVLTFGVTTLFVMRVQEGKSRTSFIMVKRERIGHLTKQVICPNSQLVFCKMMCNDFSHATLPFANRYSSHFFGCCIVSVMKPLNSLRCIYLDIFRLRNSTLEIKGWKKFHWQGTWDWSRDRQSRNIVVCAMATEEKVNYQLFMCAVNIPIGYSFEGEGGSQTLFISTIRQQNQGI